MADSVGSEQVEGKWWHMLDDNRVQCNVCPQLCRLRDGERGLCFVRQNLSGHLILTTYGRTTGFCVDPIEKKPLNHFLPSTSILSFGTGGCNLGCKYCQNWSISKSSEVSNLSEKASPKQIADLAVRLGCRSVAFTYNDPIVWAEYAIDTAHQCHRQGIRTVAVTNGYITPAAREEFFLSMDAANIDLKGFCEGFHKQLTLSHLEPVLETLLWLKNSSNVWFEITNLIIPGDNDSPDNIEALASWILHNLGDRIPLHLTAFRPGYNPTDRPATPLATLSRAAKQAKAVGLKYVYVGNALDRQNESTFCHSCGQCIIERSRYAVAHYRLNGNECSFCDTVIPGVFDPARKIHQVHWHPVGSSSGR